VRIKIQTKVAANWKTVKDGFNETLFLKLNPPFPKVKLTRFDGSEKGDQVSMELDFILWKDKWTSDISFSSETDNGFDFIDEGNPAAFPFKKWKHHHIIYTEKGSTFIIDNIDFSSGNGFIDIILFPILYLQFLYRKPIYKRLFNR